MAVTRGEIIRSARKRIGEILDLQSRSKRGFKLTAQQMIAAVIGSEVLVAHERQGFAKPCAKILTRLVGDIRDARDVETAWKLAEKAVDEHAA